MSVWSHAQTLTAAWPFSRGQRRDVDDVTEHIAIPEGGELVVACTFLRAKAPLVVVLHGVSGSSEDHYVVRAGRALVRAGFHVARLNQRGSGLGLCQINSRIARISTARRNTFLRFRRRT